MERLGDILKRTGTQSRERTGISSNGELTEEVATDCPVCKGASFVHPGLPSGLPDFTRVIPCRCNKGESDEERLLWLRHNSGDLGLKLLSGMSFGNFEKRPNLSRGEQMVLEDAVKLARRFAEDPEGWVVFQGRNGCGKTHLAAAIGNYQLQKGKPVFFKVVPDLLDHLRSTFRPDSNVTSDELFEKIKTVPLLILDDFGEQASTDWAQEKLYQLINHRYNDRLPMVITTCFPLEEMELRIISRIADPQISTFFEIDAPDYRANSLPLEEERRKTKGRRGPTRKW
jgi:DNA replication protein DnaC